MEVVNCPIYENSLHRPNQLALVAKERTWTYQELDVEVQTLCHFLEHASVKENQRVAFVAHPSVATILLFFALFRLHAIACPLSYRLPPDLLTDYIKLLKASHVLEPSLLPPDRVKARSSHTKIHLNDLATFLFTSGSGGTPKIACHRFANHYYNAVGSNPFLNLKDTSRWLLSLPLFHVSGIGILFRCFLQGAMIVLSELPLTESILQHNISHLSLVPTQLMRLLKESPETLEKMRHSLQCILLGGAPISPSLLAEATRSHLPVYATYGMTEMSSMIALAANSQELAGKVLPHRQLKIEEGQIWVGGETLFQGYWDSTRETILKADKQGWFPTKDLGKLTPEENVQVTGRLDRQFISGGENIQPEEIEKALCTIPGIRQATVLPLPDAEFGERPVAFIDDETTQHTLESIREGLKNNLPTFKHPVHVFPYPKETGLKPNLDMLKLHLYQLLKSLSKRRE